MVKILLDAMGGDNAPAATVEGACLALANDPELSLVLTGRKEAIEAELKKHQYDATRLEIVDCPDVIDMNDIPTEAIRKKGASLVVGYQMLKKQEDIQALVTAGSTGAAIVGGQLLLGRIRGVKRPALCCAIPNSRGSFTLLCDCGANAECKPIMLCQFAVLATAYAKAAFGIQNPKVGLLNNGTEEHKGDPLHQQVNHYLSQMQDINYIGNVEGRDIMYGEPDIVVCDGFSGNVALKSIEGCAKMMLQTMKTQFKSSIFSMIGSLFMLGAIKRMKNTLDFDKVGGAMLLGVKKPVVKSHGSSKPKSIERSIASAASIVRGGLVGSIEELLQKVDLDNIIPAEE